MSKCPVRVHLLDVVTTGVVLPPLPSTTVLLDEAAVSTHNDSLREALHDATCIEATNVARFFDDSYLDGRISEAFWSDLKCLVPPYQKFFVEWDRPCIPAAKRMGMLFMACAPDQAEGVVRTLLGARAWSTPAKIVEFRRDVRCRWIYLTMDFLEFPHTQGDGHISGLRGPYHVGVCSVADDGALVDFWMSHGSVLSEGESLQVAAASLVGWTTLAMMNCANIDTVKHQAPAAFQRSRARSGKHPLVAYHTVRVNLDRTPRVVVAESLPSAGSPPRRHKKRGHLKDYRRGKGLFGRYQGVWFWGDMQVGSEAVGTIVADYQVNPKKTVD